MRFASEQPRTSFALRSTVVSKSVIGVTASLRLFELRSGIRVNGKSTTRFASFEEMMILWRRPA